MQEPVRKYIQACQDDLEAARILIEAGQRFYTPFLCHQALQKILRGYFLETHNRYPPMNDDLLALADATDAGSRLDASSRRFAQSLSIYPQVVSNPVYRQKILQATEPDKARETLACARSIAKTIRELF